MQGTGPGELFATDGDYGALLRRHDWAATPLGPPQRWSQSLRAAVRLVLSSRYPMLIFWGEQCSQVYNEAYAGLIGDKHPAALGEDVRVTLAEGWSALAPVIEEVFDTGRPSWIPALRLLLERSGYREETYFSVSHALARDDDGRPAGIFTVCSEVTEQVVGERRLRFLRDLGLLPADTRGVDETAAAVLDALASDPLDVPFAALYLLDGVVLRRAGQTAQTPRQALPDEVHRTDGDTDGWGVAAAARDGRAVVAGVADRLGQPAGAWSDPLDTVVSLALPSGEPARPLGVLCLGVSPSRALDDGYTSFVDLVAQQVAAALRSARAYEEERRRAEALAELDRAKTTFFTNISHEFRTPLTLMLGPLTDALGDREAPLEPRQQERVSAALDNTHRLLALVNNLLAFSSVQAGRSREVTATVDLAGLTAEYASVFRAAAERVRLRLLVDAPPLSGPALVDAADWEKIVGNLLSNALKFTFVGTIQVRLRDDGDEVTLAVEDTGIGIGEEDLPRLFERFHRVQGVRSRSHEGTGIGLALVHELATLYGGTVRVASAPGSGTTFTVALPWSALRPAGEAPAVPPDAPATQARALAAQAERWAQQPPPSPQPEPARAAAPADPDEAPLRVLVADDNADMRVYLVRLLSEQGWLVDAVADGAAALAAARDDPPDLVLTDVMMPELDGFGLVQRLRRDAATAAVPIVVLTARAGPAQSVGLLNLGADDYVVKPFNGADLVARARATVRLARLRGHSTGSPAAPARTAAVVASGRALDAALRAVTEQARMLLDAERAVTVLVGDGAAPLEVAATDPTTDPTTGPTTGPAPDGRDTLAVALLDRRGGALGSLTVWAGPGRRFEPGHRLLLEPFAPLLTALAETGWRLEHEPPIAAALRRGVPPPRLPDTDSVELSAAYRPAAAPAATGGGWYDAFTLPDHRLALVVGDVDADGVTAAVAVGQLRSAVRARLLAGDPPERALEHLSGLAARLLPPSTASCLVALLNPADGALRWCSAGHPPPVLLEPGQPPTWLAGPVSPPLGGPAGATAAAAHTVVPGGLVVLGTSGPAAPRDGHPTLPERVGAVASGRQPRGIVEALLPDVAAERGAAVLAVRRADAPAEATAATADGLSQRWTYPLTPRASAAMRRDLSRTLNAAGVGPEMAYQLMVAASEAVNNAVEHAQDPSRPDVEFAVDVRAGRIVLTVQDFGRWRGRGAALDRGHGSALMAAAGEVRVVPTAAGTTVTIERDLTAD